ncbi:hypothetical protein B7463_g12560, partial [Scytalidium lignicola]
MTLSVTATANTVESLITAVLLGLYEILTCTKENIGEHVTHARGVSAILSSKGSPFDLLGGMQLFQLSNPLILKEPLQQKNTARVLCAPISNTSVQNLDTILINFNPIFYTANDLLSDTSEASNQDIIHIMEKAMELDKEFAEWAINQPQEWLPVTVSEYPMPSIEFMFHGNRNIDTYFDLYVAAVWNTYRKTHLLALDVIYRCMRWLGNGQTTYLELKAKRLADEIAASIPFHLQTSLPTYTQQTRGPKEPSQFGKPVGGLFLLHPLWVVSISSIIPSEICTCMREWLKWIGLNLGIQQALLLADNILDRIMLDLIRDSPVGYCLRYLTRNRWAAFSEHQPQFKIPDAYKSNSHSCEEDRSILVTWYSADDPDNPHNWSPLKKGWVSFVILLYTFTIYIGSSLYVVSIPGIVEVFHVTNEVGSLGLSLYVLGYGAAPMILSPLSEIPSIGRNLPYIITFFLFFICCIPLCLVNSLAGLLILRLLLGCFGSPALATGGASYGDFFSANQMPYVIALWGGGATLAPALGPLIGGFAVQLMGWRWSSWELLWLSGIAFILMFMTLPETSSDFILLYRAKRLRVLTGRTNLKAESETRQSHMRVGDVARDALVKPWQINILDPAVLFSTVYTALIYGIYYSFFESFPIVYGGIYGFSLGEIGLAFLAVLVGLVIAVMLYCSYFYFVADAKFAHSGPEGVPPEARLWPGLIATFFIPIGLFIFAWTARAGIHWFPSLVGVATSMFGVFIITQSMFLYLPFTYPRYSGSLFAANGFARSMFAAGAILYARPMFKSLGVDGAVSLLGGLTVLCCGGDLRALFSGCAVESA